MKKFLIVALLVSVFSVSIFAAETIPAHPKTDGKWTDFTYVNVPIIKVMEAKNGYYVIYEKNSVGVGSVVIPKEWARGSNESPRKLKFRKVRRADDCYMTIVKDNGEFKRVILTLPMNKANSVWGVVKGPNSLDGCDKDTLEEIEL